MDASHNLNLPQHPSGPLAAAPVTAYFGTGACPAIIAPVSPNKTTVHAYFQAFNHADRERILALLTPDVVWDIPRTHLGSGHAAGSEAFVQEALKAPAGTVSTITRLVEEGDVVVAEGTVSTTTPDSSPFHLLFCDIFHLHNAKITRLTSYLAQPE